MMVACGAMCLRWSLKWMVVGRRILGSGPMGGGGGVGRDVGDLCPNAVFLGKKESFFFSW